MPPVRRSGAQQEVPLTFFAKAPEQIQTLAENIATPEGNVSRAAIESAFEQTPPGTEMATHLTAMAAATRDARRSDAAVAPHALWSDLLGRGEGDAVVASADVAEHSKATAEDIAFRAGLDRNIIGQDRAKNDLALFMAARREEEPDKPTSLFIAGPPGCGKSEMAHALAEQLSGNRDAVMMIDCTTIKDRSGFSQYFGIGAGFVGHDMDAPALTQKKFDQVCGQGTPVILVDEVDKLPEEFKDDFYDALNKALENGILPLQTGERVNIKDAVIIFTSNAGHDDSRAGKTGEALRQHYKSAGVAALGRDHVVSRLDAVTSADSLTADESRQVAELILAKTIKKKVAKLEREAGISVGLTVSPALVSLIGDIALSDRFGVRPLKKVIKNIIETPLNKMMKTMVDEGRYEIAFDVKTLASNLGIKDEQRAELKLKTRFNETIQADNSIPDEYKAPGAFPLKLKTISRPPQFSKYEGSVPHNPIENMIPLSSGTIGGQGFAVLDQNGADAKNEFFLLKPGVSQARDAFIPVKLPEDLAQANFSLQTVKLSENQLFFYGVNKPEDGDEGEAIAYLYNHNAASAEDKFKAVKAPRPMVDAQLVALDENRVLLTGGRELSFDEDTEQWSIEDDPIANNGKPVENSSYVCDFSLSNGWQNLKKMVDVPEAGREPQSSRVGVATVRHGDDIYFVGGEERQLQAHGVAMSVSSNKVDIFNSKTLEWRKGEDLPVELAYGSAFVDLTGTINVLGGCRRLESGTDLQDLDVNLRYRPTDENAVWKRKAAIPQAASDLLVVPHVQGFLVGPFYDDNKFEPNFQLLS